MTDSPIAPDSIDALIARQLPRWLTGATPELLAQLRTCVARQQQAQAQLKRALGAVTPLDRFAEPLLSQALADAGLVEVDLRTAQLNVVYFRPNPPIAASLPPSFTRTEQRQTLLAAALQNFHQRETAAEGFARGSCLLDAHEQPLAMSPVRFAEICRSLDLGQQYQNHLKSHLLDEAAGPAVATAMEQALRINLEVAAVVARARNEIDQATFQPILHLLAAQQPDAATLRCHSLRLLGKRLIGALAMELRQADKLLGVIAWLPDDPYAPVSWHASWQSLYLTLGLRLRSGGYRIYIQRLIAERDRVGFNAVLKARLAKGGNDVPLEVDGRHFAIEGDVFASLRREQLDKMLDDARVLAVPTGDEDSEDRRARLHAYLELGLDVLGLAAFFVPGLGEVMLGVIAVQIAGDVYEGYEDWQLGDREAALEHLFNVAETVALVGITAGAAHGLGKLAQRVSKVDGLLPVALADGRLRLCDPGLPGYAVEEGEQALDVGQTIHQGSRQHRRLHEGVYVVAEDSAGGDWQIRHPGQPDAYSPRLEHNDAGDWRHEFERPRYWDDPVYLVRRLASRTAAISEQEAQSALRSTGFDTDRLRRLHLENAPPPARLLDVIERQQLHARYPQVQGDAFEEIFNNRQVHPQPADQVLMRDFTGLTPRCAREIVEQASSVELDSLLSAQRVPLSLAEQARWAVRDSRLDRACAALYQAGTIAEGVEVDRVALAKQIGLAPVGQGIRPPQRLLDGRLGYPLSGRGQGSRQALLQGFGHLFPLLDDAQLERYLQGLTQRQVDPWQHFSQLRQGREALQQTLHAWRNEPGLGLIRRLRRAWVARRILGSWRRLYPGMVEGDFHLTIEGDRVGALPLLPAGVDFSHITHLTLRNMQLDALDAALLGRFSGVRNLDLRDNRLTRLPTGIEHLAALRNLRLGNNRIVLTAEDNLRLGQLTGLRRLDLNGNPIGMLPPLGSFLQLRRLSLRRTGVQELPAELAVHGHLQALDMRDNQIRVLPDELFGFSPRLLRRLHLHDNPLTENSALRLQRARQSADAGASSRVVHGQSGRSPGDRWLRGFTPAQREQRLAQWQRLQQAPGSDDLMRFLADLLDTHEYQSQPRDVQTRVWHIIDACEQHAEVRSRLFELVSGPRTCSDEFLMTLSELEVGALVARANAQALGVAREPALAALGRSLYRLDRVNAIAARHVAELASSDPVEVYLTYRVRLADSLDLPAQPGNLAFQTFSGVTAADLGAARAEVLQEETTQALAEALADREFWVEHLHTQQAARFEHMDAPFHQRLQALLEQGRTMPDQAYLQQVEQVVTERETAERDLIIELSREAVLRQGWQIG